MIAMAEVKGVASHEKHVFAGQEEGSVSRI
jgi:hypothetical protein